MDCLGIDMDSVYFGSLYLMPSSNGVSRPSAVRGRGYRMINMGELFAHNIIRDIPMERVELSPKERLKFLVQENDLLFARQSLVAAGAGKCSIVKQLNEETTFESHLIRVRLDEQICNPLYYYYLFQLPYNPIKSIVNQCAQAGIRGKELSKVKVPRPEIKTQTRIASILSSYDDSIENNNRRIKILEKMAENLYKEWFVRFRFPGYEQAEFENGIPKGWAYKTVEELSDVLRRGISPTYDSDGKYTVINQKCIRSSILDMSEAQQQSKPYKSELNLQDGDAVICSTGTGTLGRVGQVYGEYKDTTYDSHVTLVRANQVVGRHFLYWSLKELQPWFMNMGIGSTNQQELYRGTIKNAKILVPGNVDLLDAFEDYIQDIHCQIGLLRDKIQNLTKQRDMLLPRLMSGKLEV